ncbi:MAG: AAA family ATPase [Thermoplasmatales archaeon]|nr:AAA family ATPase [Thermoplasmatales archaeon]
MKENEKTEFKEIYNEAVIKTAVTFLNGNGGTIFIGIKDDGVAVGVADPDETCRAAVSGISNNIRPDAIAAVSVRETEVDGKSVVRIDVSAGTNKPYYLRNRGMREGGVFIRRGPSSVPAPEPLIIKMAKEWSSPPYESSPSLHQNLTFNETSAVFQKCGVEWGERQMVSLGLVSNDMYTNLAHMLSDQFPQGIKLATFGDEYKVSFGDRKETSGSVLRQLEEAVDFVDKHNSRRSKIVGMYREDSRDYPPEAVREALINAVAHRDYSINGSTLVSMFNDKMTVSSIGGLNKGISKEDILLGTSSRRNEGLASVMYRLGIMETYGTGIPRIMGMYRDEPLSPTIEITTGLFKITLPKMSNGELSPEAIAAMDLFSGERPIKRSDIEEGLGVSKTKAHSILSELEGHGYIVRVGAGRSTMYRRRA